MKKLIISTVGAIVIVGSAFGQGAVNWGAISFTSVTAQTNTVSYSPLFGGGSAATDPAVVGAGKTGLAGGSATTGSGFYYELLIGSVWNGSLQAAPTTLAGLSAWSDSGLGATNSNNAGRLTVINANSAATVNGLSTSVSNNIVLVGWSANLGSTWASALATLNSGVWSGNAFLGLTGEGAVEAAALPTSQGNTIFGSAAQSYGIPIYSLLTPLYIVPTPEPTTMALAALGGAAMLFIRRKK